jgi:hypothetical protein
VSDRDGVDRAAVPDGVARKRFREALEQRGAGHGGDAEARSPVQYAQVGAAERAAVGEGELEGLDRAAQPVERHPEPGGRGRSVAEDRHGRAVGSWCGRPFQHPNGMAVGHEPIGQGQATDPRPDDDHVHAASSGSLR